MEAQWLFLSIGHCFLLLIAGHENGRLWICSIIKSIADETMKLIIEFAGRTEE